MENSLKVAKVAKVEPSLISDVALSRLIQPYCNLTINGGQESSRGKYHNKVVPERVGNPFHLVLINDVLTWTRTQSTSST